MRKQRVGTLVVIMGVVMLMAGLALVSQPFYTYAGEEERCRISATPADRLFNLKNMNPGDTVEHSLIITNEGDKLTYILVQHERVSQIPPQGEPDLFQQLHLIVRHRGVVIYNGPMSGFGRYNDENLDIEGVFIGPIPGKGETRLDFKVFLDGPETGNEYQGVVLKTRLKILCGGSTIIIPPEDPGTDPKRPPKKPLPKTDGFAALVLIASGVVMITAGLALRKRINAELDRIG